MLKKKTLYCLDDIAIVPSPISNISSRSECVARRGKMLPLWTSPMPNVVNRETAAIFVDAGIYPIIPRGNGHGDELSKRIDESKTMFVAFSLEEFIKNYRSMDGVRYVLIDMANGHMKKLGDTIKAAKDYNPEMVIMAGNVANSKTYEYLSRCGADFVRVSIGTGSACNTTTFTGVGYGMASLIDECAEMRKRNDSNIHFAKIIADGGCKKIRDIIKCLALGADYVMLGGMLNACSDSAGEIVWEEGEAMKLYYGMASEMGAKTLGKSTNYPEGKVKYNKISGTIREFADKFENYLKSAMSYCNAMDLFDFTQNTTLMILSPNAQKAFNQS